MAEIKPDEKLDLTGVTCPQNVAQALLKLEIMETGSILEIIIDDGEPIQNVPPSIKVEGHKLLEQKKIGEKWILLVKKI